MKRIISIIVLLLNIVIVKSNNISISNVSIPESGVNNTDNYVMVEFDITWENSWRTSIAGGGYGAPYNWDAAWVFVKYRVGSGAWQHAWLNNTGHTAPSGSTIDIGLLTPGSAFHATTNPGLGAFIYRDANGTGTFTKTDVQLRWNYGANGLSDANVVDIQVYATEMVYVPQGSYELGDTRTTNGTFYKYGEASTTPYTVSSEGEITIGTTNGNLYHDLTVIPTGDVGDRTGPIPADFPKGYNAFYAMKYEISQQAYVNFLNTLNYTQQAARTATAPSSSAGTGALKNTNTFRSGIDIQTSGTNPGTPAVYACNLDADGNYNESNDGQGLACNWLKFTDVTAYLDWAGLRPMTELEFEKICRGSGVSAVNGEYAWGATSIAAGDNYAISNDGATNEYISSNYSGTNGNALSNETNGTVPQGPIRVGACTMSSSTRVTGGVAYYGASDMSGNLLEQVVSAGTSNGRAYTGTHGNGLVDASGEADASNWPVCNGSGLKGGSFARNNAQMRISDRAFIDADGAGWCGRWDELGGRGVRTAP